MKVRSSARWVFLGTLLCSLGMLLLCQPTRSAPLIPTAHARSAQTSPVTKDAPPRKGLAELPLTGQTVASAALGRDDPLYHVASTKTGYRASNPAAHLTASFGNNILLSSGRAEWGITFRGIGYREPDQLTVEPAVPNAGANRIEYRRGWLTEWYANGPLGLEQGFTIERPPVGADGSTPLQVALALSGDLHAILDSDSRGLTLASSDGTAFFRYSGLNAVDATGRELDAWLELAPPDQEEASTPLLLVRVDDVGGQYPILIDPWIQTATLTAADGANDDLFSYSTGVSGDTIVVGAYKKSTWTGAVYVFQSTNWVTMTQTAKLTPADPHEYDYFGVSVAISGNTIVVGSYGWRDPTGDPSGSSSPGAAYVYIKPSSGTWVTATQSATLTPSDGLAGDSFGSSVSIDGDTIAVGAYKQSAGLGAAYVFVKPTSGGWVTTTQTAKLTASDGSNSGIPDIFGVSVSVSGDTILVGAPYKNSYTGAAYLFVKGSSWVTMTQTAKLTASDATGTGYSGDYVGLNVSLSGDTALVGAYAWGRSSPGAAYVFVKPASGGWVTTTQTAKLAAPDGVADDWFGSSVSIHGTRIVVGAPNRPDAGAAYIFSRPESGWVTSTVSTKLTALPSASGDEFGHGISDDGEIIVVGAPKANYPGKALVFDPRTDTTTTITSDVPDSSVVGQTVTVQYTVDPVLGSGTPTGNVTVSDGTVSCTGTVAAGECTLVFTSTGAKSLTATYSGDNDYHGSVSIAEGHQVEKAETTTTITADSPDPSIVGASIPVHFVVAPVAPGGGTPNGNVTVSDGNGNNCTASVSIGECGLVLKSTGTMTLTATYAGSMDFNASLGTAHHQVNNPAPAITRLDPPAKRAGSGAFVLTVHGTGFVSGAKVRWGNEEFPTTFVSSTLLTAGVTADYVLVPRTENCTVLNPNPGGQASGAVPFTITPYAGYVPLIRK